MHVAGYNFDSVGICVAGLTKFYEAEFKSLRILLGLLKKIYSGASLHGHREFDKAKTCPVFDYSEFVTQWNGTLGG